MRDVPAGWERRNSGLLVPTRDKQPRRLRSLCGSIFVLLLVVGQIAGLVSTVSRAALDIDKVAHVLISDAWSWVAHRDAGPQRR